MSAHMGTVEDAQRVVNEVLGTDGDSAVLQYIVSCLEDEDFDYDETYDVFGIMLVTALLLAHAPLQA